MKWKADITITYQEGLLDPQSQVIEKGLESLGYADIDDITTGKYISLALNSDNKNAAHEIVEDVCARLLANPVIEEYTYEVYEVK
ncbi:MAG: phosphoribosylformylglycinamidine synthase subunit PurS [Bacillota bacterium]